MEKSNTGGAYVAARVNKGGGLVRGAEGVFFWVFTDGTYRVTNDLGQYQYSHHVSVYGLQTVVPQVTF